MRWPRTRESEVPIDDPNIQTNLTLLDFGEFFFTFDFNAVANVTNYLRTIDDNLSFYLIISHAFLALEVY